MRVLLVLIVLVGAGFFLMGYRPGSFGGANGPGSGAVIDPEKARERGAELGEKGAVAAARIRDSVNEASITGKIKAKMALDDTIQARSVDVTTEGTTVTVSGTVRTAAEKTRVVALARETEGVTNVVDRLAIKP
jgi:hypothetical protein